MTMRIQAFSKQAGSIFANLALGTVAVGSVAAVTADWTAQQSALAQQKQQGYLFAKINDAVGNYMTLLFPELTKQSAAGVDDIPASCATLPYRAGTSLATEPVIVQKKCALTLTLKTGGSFTVANAYQPTLAELKAMALLDNGISDTPVLPVEMVVAGPDKTTGAASTTPAPNGYAISIKPLCVGKDGAVTTPTAGSSSTTCSNTNKVLTSSVINIQPFVMSQYVQNFMPLLWTAGPDAAISGPPDATNVVEKDKRANPNGEFRSTQSGWTRENPITREWSYTAGGATSTYTRGVDNLVLMRNGYDSAYWQLTRRDGSSSPTADWDFNGKNLTNVGKFQAASGEITGDFKVGGDQTVTGNQSVTGDVTVGGSQTVKGNQSVAGNVTVDGTGTFKGLLSALGNLLVKGATELQGRLTVAGIAYFKSAVIMESSLRVDGNTQLDGPLTGTSATFADSLSIGSTKITRDGTLLGGPTGWGVSSGSACSQNYALAQSTDGKLQICRNGAWASLITNENVVIPAPAVGDSCSPEGAPGRLPDGTLAVCKDGKWQATLQGSASEGTACFVEGALATTTASPSTGLVLLGCRGGKWSSQVFAKPKLSYGQAGQACDMEDEWAVDNKSGYWTPLLCKNKVWTTPGTQLQSNMLLGDYCKLNGAMASDKYGTGLMICQNGVWSALTAPHGVGGSCDDNGLEMTQPGGARMVCDGNIWSIPSNGQPCRHSFLEFRPDTGVLPYETLMCLPVLKRWVVAMHMYRWDRVWVVLHSPVQVNGFRYYIYSEMYAPGVSPGKTYLTQSLDSVAWMLLGATDDRAQRMNSTANCTRSWARKQDWVNVTVCLPNRNDFVNVIWDAPNKINDIPAEWYGQNFDTVWNADAGWERLGYGTSYTYWHVISGIKGKRGTGWGNSPTSLLNEYPYVDTRQNGEQQAVVLGVKVE